VRQVFKSNKNAKCIS